MKEIFGKLHSILERDTDAELVTIVANDGSSPRGKGSQMLVCRSGRVCGTIGGGAVEKESETLAMSLIAEKRSAVHDYVLRKSAGEDIGMECGGNVTVYFQYIDHCDDRWDKLCMCVGDMIEHNKKGLLVQHMDGSIPELVSADEQDPTDHYDIRTCCNMRDGIFTQPLPVGERVIIFGGGHCALALAPILDSVGFRVSVMDCREEYVTEGRFPMAEQRVCGEFDRISDHFDISNDDYIVVMTNGHLHDYEVEEQVLRCDPAYVGVIGSRQKTAAVNEKLRNAGVPEDVIQRVHTPIGLKIKAVTPAEIAVSIAAEMILVRAEHTSRYDDNEHGCPMQ